jgi:hypothetical protein
MAGNDPPIVPPALVPGSRIAVIAPSSPFDRALVLRGMGWLSERYRVSWIVTFREGIPRRPDERRSTARLASQGSGFCRSGRARVRSRAHRAPPISASAAIEVPVGFPDATVLHVSTAWSRLAHAHNGGRRPRRYAPARPFKRLHPGERARCAARTWVPGTAQDRWSAVISPCFSCLGRTAATGRRRPRRRDRQAYRVDRMLTASWSRALSTNRRHRRRRLHRLPTTARCHGAEVLEKRLRPLGVPIAAVYPRARSRQRPWFWCPREVSTGAPGTRSRALTAAAARRGVRVSRNAGAAPRFGWTTLAGTRVPAGRIPAAAQAAWRSSGRGRAHPTRAAPRLTVFESRRRRRLPSSSSSNETGMSVPPDDGGADPGEPLGGGGGTAGHGGGAEDGSTARRRRRAAVRGGRRRRARACPAGGGPPPRAGASAEGAVMQEVGPGTPQLAAAEDSERRRERRVGRRSRGREFELSPPSEDGGGRSSG